MDAYKEFKKELDGLESKISHQKFILDINQITIQSKRERKREITRRNYGT